MQFLRMERLEMTNNNNNNNNNNDNKNNNKNNKNKNNNNKNSDNDGILMITTRDVQRGILPLLLFTKQCLVSGLRMQASHLTKAANWACPTTMNDSTETSASVRVNERGVTTTARALCALKGWYGWKRLNYRGVHRIPGPLH